MKENKYDDQLFFDQYAKMSRSVMGLQGAGEWHALRTLLPDLTGKRLLDLGCGYGWHCRYAIEQGADSVVGIDLSEKMIEKARSINTDPRIEYRVTAVEEFDYFPLSFDVVLSSLTFHYIELFDRVCRDVHRCLTDRGTFLFSVEHPIFTAAGSQQWHTDEQGKPLHWPVDNYFSEGARNASFLGCDVVKYHKTLTTYLNDLIENGFEITRLIEPTPEKELLNTIEGMKEELRRPMMLIIAAQKRG